METPRNNSGKRTLLHTLLIRIRHRLSTRSEKTRAHSQAYIKAISVQLSISVGWALKMWSKCSTFSPHMIVTVHYLNKAPISSLFLRTEISRKSHSSLTQAFLENPLKDQIDHWYAIIVEFNEPKIWGRIRKETKKQWWPSISNPGSISLGKSTMKVVIRDTSFMIPTRWAPPNPSTLSRIKEGQRKSSLAIKRPNSPI